MTTKSENGGRVTLRDIIALQREIYEKLEKINKELAGVKIKVALLSAAVSFVVSVVTWLVRYGVVNNG